MKTDIHSHDFKAIPGQIKVLSLQLHPNTDLEKILEQIPDEVVISAGIHPWNSSEWTSANISEMEVLLQHSRVAIIGEIGLDKVCGIPYEDQLNVFETQLRLAEITNKPVLIHNVGFQSELFSIKKKYSSVSTWILHGFRGKAPMAEQFIRNGFYLSFGSKYQPEALRACPYDRLFLETDESDMELGNLYSKIGEDLGISEVTLEAYVSRNFEELF